MTSMGSARKQVEDRARNPEGGGREKKTPAAWSAEEVETLIEMWGMRFSNAEIGAALNRGANAIGIKASRIGLRPRNLPRKPGKIRPCLKCQSPFFSEGIGHRICDSCKTSDEWQILGSGTYSILEP